MSLDQQLERDRALRDAAWNVVSDDVTWLQADLDHRSVTGRVLDKAGDKAKDLADQSLEAARRNKLALGAVAAGLALWLARRPITDAAKSLWADWRAKSEPGENEISKDDAP